MSSSGASGPRDGLLFILLAPSGGGKTTLAKRLLAAEPSLRFSVSHTTRSPRPGEAEGRDYHFVSRDEFEARRRAGGFVESAEVHGDLYGTSAEELHSAADAGADLLFDIDVQGAAQIRRARPDAVTVFLLPPDWETLRARLAARSSENAAARERRLRTAVAEVQRLDLADYIVINRDLDEALGDLRAILRAERLRSLRMGAPAAACLAGFPAARAEGAGA